MIDLRTKGELGERLKFAFCPDGLHFYISTQVLVPAVHTGTYSLIEDYKVAICGTTLIESSESRRLVGEKMNDRFETKL
jgi:hypothetical protein